MSDTTLRMLLHEVRSKTLKRLEGLSEEESRWSPAGLHNSCLWHGGHAYIVVEFLTQTALGREPELPEGWWELFSWESKPAEVHAGRWPSLAEVTSQLRAQEERLGQVVEGLTAEELGSASQRKPDQTVRYAILHGLHDEACHSGEIWLLRKLRALGGGQTT